MPAHIAQMTLVVIAAPAGLMRNALEAYLRSLPNTEVKTIDTAASLDETLAQSPVRLLLLDPGLTAGWPELVTRLTQQWPSLRLAVLAGTLEQQAQALAAGAALAPLNGLTTEWLAEAAGALSAAGHPEVL